MTKYSITVCTIAATLVLSSSQAQSFSGGKEGRVVYEKRSAGLRVTIGDQTYAAPDNVSKSELLFSNGQTLFRDIPGSEQAQTDAVVTCAMDPNEVIEQATYYNFNQMKKVSQKEAAGRKYLVEDSIAKFDWKITDETKTIAGYPCKKAKSYLVKITKQIQIGSGGFDLKEKRDSTAIEVWFSPAIAVQGGPEYAGQLPGLVMQVVLNKGELAYTVLEVSPVVKASEIVAPTEGKKLSTAAFETEIAEIRTAKEKLKTGNLNL